VAPYNRDPGERNVEVRTAQPQRGEKKIEKKALPRSNAKQERDYVKDTLVKEEKTGVDADEVACFRRAWVGRGIKKGKRKKNERPEPEKKKETGGKGRWNFWRILGGGGGEPRKWQGAKTQNRKRREVNKSYRPIIAKK